MTNRLLTTGAIQHIAANMDDQGDDRFSLEEVLAVVEAQDTKTLGVVGEYLERGWMSDVEEHRLVSFAEIGLLKQGKMPGEVDGTHPYYKKDKTNR